MTMTPADDAAAYTLFARKDKERFWRRFQSGLSREEAQKAADNMPPEYVGTCITSRPDYYFVNTYGLQYWERSEMYKIVRKVV